MVDPLRTDDDFAFVFPDGPKFQKDMTRDELLHVIRYLRSTVKWKDEHNRKMANVFRGLGYVGD